MKVGLIVSTGFDLSKIAEQWDGINCETQWGIIPFRKANVGDLTIYAATRNGASSCVPPHKVNYKGIMASFKKLGIAQIVSSSVVGSLNPDIRPGDVVILDQFLDFTKRTPFTAFEHEFAFCDFTEPYCSRLRALLIGVCGQLEIEHHKSGCYVGVDGPRYETAAEVRMFHRLGGDVVGMTNVQECIMARESGICYSSAALVVNYGAGIAGPVTRKDCYEQTLKKIGELEDLIAGVIVRLRNVHVECSCSQVPLDLITYK